jgi:hypothetical protein
MNINLQASTKVICELEGTYSITYEDVTKNFLSEGIDLFRNLAVQTQQSIFLLQKAKTNFAEEFWQKDPITVTQYWEINKDDTMAKLNYVFEPAPIWINPEAKWVEKNSEKGIEILSTMMPGDVHPVFNDYKVDLYRISNTVNWFTGKGRIDGDIWLSKNDGTKNKNPKVEIQASGKCSPQARKF